MALEAPNRPLSRETGVPGGGGVGTAADPAMYYQALLRNRDGLWDRPCSLMAQGTYAPRGPIRCGAWHRRIARWLDRRPRRRQVRRKAAPPSRSSRTASMCTQYTSSAAASALGASPPTACSDRRLRNSPRCWFGRILAHGRGPNANLRGCVDGSVLTPLFPASRLLVKADREGSQDGHIDRRLRSVSPRLGFEIGAEGGSRTHMSREAQRFLSSAIFDQQVPLASN